MKLFISCITLFMLLQFHSQTLIAEYERVKIEKTDTIDKKEKEAHKKMSDGLDEEQRKKVQDFFNQPIYYILTNSNNMSEFTIKPQEEKDLSFSSGEGDTFTSISFSKGNTKPQYWVKNFETQQLISQETILEKYFLIEEEIEEKNWVITEETKQFGDFTCTKATLKLDKKTVSACFTEDIPLPDGPFLYYGLPGLIIELEDDAFKYSLISLKLLDTTTEIKTPTEGKAITREKFDQTKAEKFKNGPVISTTSTISK